jgi:hypothetical protein
MRVAEIMSDFRNLQHYLVQLRAAPTAEEYYLEGYSLLRECTSEAQSILQTPFSGGAGAATGDAEREKQQLRAYVTLSILIHHHVFNHRCFLLLSHVWSC